MNTISEVEMKPLSLPQAALMMNRFRLLLVWRGHSCPRICLSPTQPPKHRHPTWSDAWYLEPISQRQLNEYHQRR